MKITKLINTIIFTCLLCLTGSCTDQRDLYVPSYPYLLVINDWNPAKISADDGATCMLYDRSGTPKELMPNGNRKAIALDKGMYDILVFNELMFSPTQTHLDYVYFRGEDNFETLEAVVTEMNSSDTFRASSEEVIVNNPAIVATRSTAGTEIKNRKKYEMKYQNGVNGFPTNPQYLEDSVFFSPCRITHTCQVIARVHNAASAYKVQAKLHGFAKSVFMAHRLPAHSSITHQFTLNSLKYEDSDNPTVGTIKSPVFTTFGPPLDLPGREYTIDVYTLLTNGEEYEKMTFDVTDQVETAISYLAAERLKNTPIMETFYIYIEFTLPIVSSTPNSGVDVGLEEWGNDVIITVPM